jgi:hypothetical protein
LIAPAGQDHVGGVDAARGVAVGNIRPNQSAAKGSGELLDG